MNNNMNSNTSNYMNNNVESYGNSNTNSSMNSNVGSYYNSNTNSNMMNINANANDMANSNESVHGLQKLSDREKLLMTVQAYEFALVEVGLFLNTHPTDRTALAYFKQYRELKHKAVSEYTRMYGPITMDHMENDLSTWKWIENPWPWEIGSEG